MQTISISNSLLIFSSVKNSINMQCSIKSWSNRTETIPLQFLEQKQWSSPIWLTKFNSKQSKNRKKNSLINQNTNKNSNPKQKQKLTYLNKKISAASFITKPFFNLSIRIMCRWWSELLKQERLRKLYKSILKIV